MCFSPLSLRGWLSGGRLGAGALGLLTITGVATPAQEPETEPDPWAAPAGVPRDPGLAPPLRVDLGGNPAERTRLIYFPPNPPPLGVTVPNRPRPMRGSLPAPRELSDFVTEPFYAPLSAALSGFSPGKPRGSPLDPVARDRLDNFVRQRTDLLAELRATLARVMPLPPPTRLPQLTAFAEVQAPRLAQLENDAENLRALLAKQYDWNAAREWKLGRGRLARPRAELRTLEYEVVRAAAYFQEGLAPAQRRLLRELAMEMGDGIRAKNGEPAIGDYYLTFLPETARIPRPASPAAALADLIARFEEEKAALKTELADALFTADGVMFASMRKAPLEKLAQEQAHRLEALERLAEEIRRTLAQVPAYPRTLPPAPLPADLARRLDAYEQDARAYTAARNAFLQQRMASLPRIVTAVSSTGAARPPGIDRETIERRRAEGEEALREFLASHAEQRRELEAHAGELAPALEAQIGAEAASRMAATPTLFLADYFRQRAQQQILSEYDIAVLEPGLSPAQRRLLFGAAIAGLNLPLPSGERPPTAAPGTLLPAP